MNQKIALYLEEGEGEIIKKASKKLSLAMSSFCRMIVLEKAKQILNEADKNATKN